MDCELIFHNVMVEDLRKKMGGVFQKGHELLKATAKLREEKLEVEVRLLNLLKELQKAWEVFDLQEKVASAHSEISSLRE